MKLPSRAGVRFRASRHLNRILKAGVPFRVTEQQSVMIIGSPRSGTTWLQGLVAWEPTSLPIFEPFAHLRPEGVPFDAPRLRFEGIEQLDADSQREVADWLRKAIRGQVCGPWELRGATPTDVIRARRVIVKSIRLTRSLPWLLQQIPAERVVAIVRDPFAVVESFLAVDWVGTSRSPRTGYQQKSEVFAADWAVDTRAILQIFNPDEIVWYDEVVRAPHRLEPVLRSLGIGVPHDLAQRAMTRASTGGRGSRDPILDDSDRRRIVEIAARFDLEVSPGARPRLMI